MAIMPKNIASLSHKITHFDKKLIFTSPTISLVTITTTMQLPTNRGTPPWPVTGKQQLQQQQDDKHNHKTGLIYRSVSD